MAQQRSNLPDLAPPLHRDSAVAEMCAVARPERLVGLGFRRGMTALRTGDRSCWAFAWQEFANETDVCRADDLLDSLTGFVGAVSKSAGRRIETFPSGCPGFCRDECLAISMIAACQHGACPALRACAFALLNSGDVDGTLRAAGQFAHCLRQGNQMLSQDAVCSVMHMAAPASERFS